MLSTPPSPAPLSPILFHPGKHHLGWLRQQLSLPEADFQALLLTLGASQMDLYAGTLDVDAIKAAIAAFLREEGVWEQPAFCQWLQERGDYAAIPLPDASVWVVRWSGPDKEAYIHLHPGRYSPHTRRVKAGTLKTALLAARHSPHQLPDTPAVNVLRTAIGLSPVKDSDDLGWREWYALLV